MIRRAVASTALACALLAVGTAQAATHTITCNGRTSGQLATLLDGGMVAPGDTVLITGFCVGDVYVQSGLTLTNHANSAALSTTDGIQGEVSVSGGPFGPVTLNGLTLKGFATDTGEDANVNVGTGGHVILSYSKVTGAQHDGILAAAGVVELASSTVSGNGVANITFQNNGIRVDPGGTVTDDPGTSTISHNKGYGIWLNGGTVSLSATSIADDGLGEILGLVGQAQIQFQNNTITSISSLPAVQLFSGANLVLRSASVIGKAGAVYLSGNSSAILGNSTLSSSTAGDPALTATSNSSITLAGGNAISNTATGGKALSVDHNSSLRHILSSRLSSSLADAPDIVTGSGAISANSSVDIGLGLIATSPSLSWTGNIALATQSQIILSGGVAVTGSLTLANNSGADFLVSGGAANTVSGGVSCPTAGTTVTSYVTNPKNVTPNVPIASTPGHCLQD